MRTRVFPWWLLAGLPLLGAATVPDGTLLFLQQQDGITRLVQRDLSSGRQTVRFDDAKASRVIPQELGVGVPRASAVQVGRSVYFLAAPRDDAAGETLDQVWRLSLDAATAPEPVFTFPPRPPGVDNPAQASDSYRALAVRPDGKALAYESSSGVTVAPLPTGAATTLPLPPGTRVSGLAFQPGSGRLFMSLRPARGLMDLRTTPDVGGILEADLAARRLVPRAGNGSGIILGLDVDAQGNLVAGWQRTPEDSWLQRWDRDGSPPRRLVRARVQRAAWAGADVLYVTDAGIHRLRAGGSVPELLVPGTGLALVAAGFWR